MATKIALDLHAALSAAKAAGETIIAEIDPPETRIACPEQDRQTWPCADISGKLSTGERFIVELDDHADPVRSFVKYWPLLYAVEKGTHQCEPIALMEITSPDSTFGAGFQYLARFVGERFEEHFPSRFRFEMSALAGKTAAQLRDEVLSFLKSSRVGSASSELSTGRTG